MERYKSGSGSRTYMVNVQKQAMAKNPLFRTFSFNFKQMNYSISKTNLYNILQAFDFM